MRALRLRIRRRLNDAGQAGMGVVLALVVVMAATGGALVNQVIEHDPLNQSYSLEHYAYRAVEAGVNDYIEALNANPYLINCNTLNDSYPKGSEAEGACSGAGYGQWVLVPGTNGTGQDPEYFMWDNPQLCFNAACTASSGTLQYVSVTVEGAAEAGGSGTYVYQSEAADLVPKNGFLNSAFWDNLNSSPSTGYSISGCTFNYDNSYNGPGGNCSNVVFDSNDSIVGPTFSNDSIYVTGSPTFQQVTTADPSCLFVGSSGTKCSSSVPNPTPGYTASTSSNDAGLEPIPTDDTELSAVAARDGCLYSGPTTLSFSVIGGVPEMAVWSSDTPSSVSGSSVTSSQNDGNNLSTNTNTCMPTVPGGNVKVPEGDLGGNGVVYVENVPQSGTCVTGANPFGDSGTTNSQYQLYWPDTSAGTYDCIGDAFVTDSSQSTPGISGPLTVGSEDDIVITGNLEYKDCGAVSGTTLNSGAGNNVPVNGVNSCGYKAATAPGTVPVNDSLGLVAEDFVEVNHPVVASGCGSFCGGGSSYTVLSNCSAYPYRTVTDGVTTNNSKTFTSATAAFTSADTGGPISGTNIPAGSTMTYVNATTVTLSNKATASGSAITTVIGGPYGTPSAALCNPADSSNNLTIDAAVLALNGAFTVNQYTVGSAENELVVYGSIEEDWRGPVGTESGGSISTGYPKGYTWDSRLGFVSPPSYLTPGTPSWALASSGDLLNNSCAIQDPWDYGGTELPGTFYRTNNAAAATYPWPGATDTTTNTAAKAGLCPTPGHTYS